jgi:DNA-binding transcriptional regulator LsrR (DeoR family)
MALSQEAADGRLMSKVSTLYYLQGLNQRQIAERLHLSRPKVSRLLKQARDEDIVQITVASPDGNYVDLESELERRHDLEEALIASSAPLQDARSSLIKKQIGTAAAEYLRRTVSDGDTLGVTWGTTLQAMMQSLRPVAAKNIHVVQTLGGVGRPEAEAHAADLSRRLAQLLDARLTSLPIPGIVGSQQVREILQSERHTQEAFSHFSELTTAFVGIGALDTNPIFEDDPNVSRDLYDELTAAGAVGDIALRFFDADGNPVSEPVSDRLIGISLDQLSNTPRVVGIAGGPAKVEAIRGALRGHVIDVLITDPSTAREVLGQ